MADQSELAWHPDLSIYDLIVVAFSGGKDSAACVLRLLDLGVPKEKIELWHHDVDGREGSNLMDWPCTRNYCKAFGDAFGIPVYYSWREGGFEREMLRKDCPTGDVFYEAPGGQTIRCPSRTGEKYNNTRHKFPQVSPDLSVRWCSAYLKIDICDRVFRNDPRFQEGGKYLVVTGERAQESKARSNYAVFEPHRADKRDGKRSKRHIDQWRPVHAWKEEAVWEILERYRINPHPAYRCGWGRVSCSACIFGSKDQWASLRSINPTQFSRIASYERQFGVTIKRKDSVADTADAGKRYLSLKSEQGKQAVYEAMNDNWNGQIILDPGDWKLPPGAYGDSTGPT